MGCSASSKVTGGSTSASAPKETPPVEVASKTPPPTVDPDAQAAQENQQQEIALEHSGYEDEQKQGIKLLRIEGFSHLIKFFFKRTHEADIIVYCCNGNIAKLETPSSN